MMTVKKETLTRKKNKASPSFHDSTVTDKIDIMLIVVRGDFICADPLNTVSGAPVRRYIVSYTGPLLFFYH